MHLKLCVAGKPLHTELIALNHHNAGTLRLSAKVPEWGLKDVRDLEKAAAPHGIILKEIIDRPANNFILLFGKK
jgi:hypothetical protein